jgi:hypothetical protein
VLWTVVGAQQPTPTFLAVPGTYIIVFTDIIMPTDLQQGNISYDM